MIFKKSRTVRVILCLAVLLLQFVLLTNYALATSTPPRKLIERLSARKWDKNLVSLLKERLTLSPAGFPELGINLAAMALVLYSDNLKFEEQLICLLELEEGMGRWKQSSKQLV